MVPESFVKRIELYETVYAKSITQFTLSSGERVFSLPYVLFDYKDMPFSKGQKCILMEGAPNGWLRVRMIETTEVFSISDVKHYV